MGTLKPFLLLECFSTLSSYAECLFCCSPKLKYPLLSLSLPIHMVSSAPKLHASPTALFFPFKALTTICHNHLFCVFFDLFSVFLPTVGGMTAELSLFLQARFSVWWVSFCSKCWNGWVKCKQTIKNFLPWWVSESNLRKFSVAGSIVYFSFLWTNPTCI